MTTAHSSDHAEPLSVWPLIPDTEIVSGERLQTVADIALTTEARHKFHSSLPAMPVAICKPDLEPEAEVLQRLADARIVFIYSDMVDGFLARILPRLRNPVVLVSHNSDAAVEERHLPALESGAIRHWFAQNAMARHPRLTALPIGVANGQWQHGNTKLLAEIAQAPVSKRAGVYANFSVATNRSVRGPLYDALRTRPFVAFPTVPWTPRLAYAKFRAMLRGRAFDATRTPLPPDVYLRDLSRWRYCVSPPGNGVDCHRTWEALYLGSVPVVSVTPPGLLDGLPHVRLDDLAGMSLEGLDAALAAMPRPFAFEKLRLSYWHTRIRQVAREVGV